MSYFFNFRQLKHHEQKLLKKVDFFSWKEDQNIREASIIRKYHLQNRYEINFITFSELLLHLERIISNITKLRGALRNCVRNY